MCGNGQPSKHHLKERSCTYAQKMILLRILQGYIRYSMVHSTDPHLVRSISKPYLSVYRSFKLPKTIFSSTKLVHSYYCTTHVGFSTWIDATDKKGDDVSIAVTKTRSYYGEVLKRRFTTGIWWSLVVHMATSISSESSFTNSTSMNNTDTTRTPILDQSPVKHEHHHCQTIWK